MDRLAGLKAFVAVVEAGGFSNAARGRGLAPSSLTRLVDALEAELGATLLQRTTRKVTPTEAGQIYYERAVGVLESLEEADAAVAGRDSAPSGLLRIAAPVAFARLHVAPLIAEFLARYPAIELDVVTDDAIADLAASDIDLAIRLGGPGDDRLVARKLAGQRRILCASPAYIAHRAAPTSPAELGAHACLTFSYQSGGRRRSWEFSAPDGEVTQVEVSGPLRCGNSEMLREAALAGLGIALLPDWLIGGDVAAGRLVALLSEWRAEPALPGTSARSERGVHGVYLPNRRHSPKLRALLSFVSERWGPDPPWAL